MTKTLKIDFVSDVVCPWCVVGLGGLETALERLEGEHFDEETREDAADPGVAEH
jgi:predicted DsbA family dithiol-disulfide isomerase